MFKGWKAKVGSVLVAIGSAIGVAKGVGVELPATVADVWQAIIGIGAALGIYGVRDKQERDNPGK